jgi:hypothetical protein
VNLRRRGAARDPGTAALDTTAALRFRAAIAPTDGSPARLWVEDRSGSQADHERERAAAWSAGVAVVRVGGPGARSAAISTAAAAGVQAITAPPALEPVAAAAPAGARLAARFDLGLWPDERVEVVLGADALMGLADRLAAFDALLAADPAPRRLILAGLAEHGPKLSPDLIAAIVHPQVLVEIRPSGPDMVAVLRQAADTVSGEPAGS